MTNQEKTSTILPIRWAEITQCRAGDGHKLPGGNGQHLPNNKGTPALTRLFSGIYCRSVLTTGNDGAHLRLEGTAKGHQQDNGHVAHPSSEIPHGHIEELTWQDKTFQIIC